MIPDNLLQIRVAEALRRDQRCQATRIGVAVEDHVVVLTGEVPSFDAREAAESDALAVGGVLDLTDELQVHPTPTRDHTDVALAHAVRHALEIDGTVPQARIHTVVSHGVVTLRGVVNSWHEIAAAEQVVGDVPGVQDLVCELEVQ